MSNIPARRPLRSSRLPKPEEKPVLTRVSRAKASSTAASTSVAASSTQESTSLKTNHVPSATNRAEVVITTAVTKRKREALGEVTNKAGKVKTLARNIERNQERERDEKTEDETARVAREEAARRAPGGIPQRKTRSAKEVDVEEQPAAQEDDDAMIVDPPAPSRRPALRPTRQTVAAAAPAPVPRRAAVPPRATRGRTRRIPVHSGDDQEPETEAEKPAMKKRRTSSAGPEEEQEQKAKEERRQPLHEQRQRQAPFEYHHREIGVIKEEERAQISFTLKAEAEELMEVEMTAEENAAREEVKWDDLDEEDAGDPLMVAEYVVEIYEYLRDLEQMTMPNPKYMDNQKELAWRMRGILMDWLIQIHSRFRLLPETLFLAVNIVDRFLSIRIVSLSKLQLVGITAMFIAAKYEEIIAPSVKNFVVISDGTYDEKEILDAEKYVLRTLDWNLSYPNPIHFLRRASKADGYDLHVRTVAKYLIEIGCVEWRLLGTTPSLVAAAGIWLARLILDKDEWTHNLEHYAFYTEEELLPTANVMLNYVLRESKHEFFYNKYASKKYLKASVYVQDWALTYWAKGDQPELVPNLEALKAHARNRREERLAQEAEAEAEAEANAQAQAQAEVVGVEFDGRTEVGDETLVE